MRKSVFSLLALVAVFAVSCNKEQAVEAPVFEGATHPVTVKGSYVGTKTAYANDKVFSWLAGDEISVMEELDGTVKFDVFTAASEGATTDFSGEISNGATLGQWAVYPANLSPAVADGTLNVTLPQYYEAGTDNPLAVLPLVGQKQEEDAYQFSTATGVLKFTFTNVPDMTGILALTANEKLYGTFAVDADGTMKLENYVGDGDSEVYINVERTEENSIVAYLPVPVGTLTAGAVVTLYSPYLEFLYEIETKQDIEVARNCVTEIATVEVPSSGLTVDDIIGTYNVTAYSVADEAENEYTLTIQANPYESLQDWGNVIFTGEFFGIPINYYPVFATFNTINGELIISDTYPIYQNSDYDSSQEASQTNWQFIYSCHVDEGLSTLLDTPVTLQFDEPGVFSSTFEGYIGTLISSGYLIGAFNNVTGTRVEETGAESGTKAAAPAKVSVRPRMNVKIPFRAELSSRVN